MTEETENIEPPNWLKELEEKRERRLKARLGHEAGAGAPCLNCEQKCPGLDLHFWRKICKNCKCSKEDHDVHDDDIYGWAQFQLLGSKPNKIKRKIVLPGKKDEVELEWSPKGQQETVDEFLKTLPPELLPVKGSQAAQDRKQMLQKQIPIHDIDPGLCHELTESELKQMNEYIAHMKQNSVGVGHIVQIGPQWSSLHSLGSREAALLAERYPKGIPMSELVKLQAQSSAHLLSKKLADMALENKHNDSLLGNKIQNYHPNAAIQTEHKLPTHIKGVRDMNYTTYSEGIGRNKSPIPNLCPSAKNIQERVHPGFQDSLKIKNIAYPVNEIEAELNPQHSLCRGSDHRVNRFIPGNVPNLPIKPMENENQPLDPNLKICSYPYYGSDGEHLEDANRKLHVNMPSYNPNSAITENLQNPVDSNINSKIYPQHVSQINTTAYNPSSANITENLKNPVHGNINSEGYPQHVSDKNSVNANQSNPDNKLSFLVKQDKILPHYAPTTLNTQKDTQNPVKIGNFKDLAFSTYDPDKISSNDELQYPTDTNKNKFEPQIQQIPPYPYYDDQSPLKTILKQKYGDYNQNKITDLPENKDAASLDPNYTCSSPRHQKSLPVYNPGNLQVTENTLNPHQVNVGPINDLIYQLPEIKSAINEINPIHQGYLPPEPFSTNADFENLPICHRCKKMFEQNEFAVKIEQNNSLFHPGCLKCAGCNQILADMFYFYDKKSDELYCLRDYAKIRGIPRCMACDELIFVKEYTLAENNTFHIKHFCCFECDIPLAGRNYVMEESQPICLPCYELLKANKCKTCCNVIKPDEQGANLKGVHFHASDACFCCKMCRKPLLGGKFMFKNEILYCSADCYRADTDV